MLNGSAGIEYMSAKVFITIHSFDNSENFHCLHHIDFSKRDSFFP